MRKVILFGGSFDPIHNGHLEVAKNALKDLKAESLWFILAKNSPFKSGHSNYHHRLSMVKKMIGSYNKMKVSTIEETMPEPSYTIDTVRLLVKKYPNTKFYWLIGSDQIKDLDKWKEFEELDSLVEFVVYKRLGYDESHKYKEIKGSPIDVSSTSIREGTSTNTHPKVLSYMMYEGLYLDSISKTMMGEKRYKHTLRVAKLAVELALAHNVDVNLAYLAAMCHDWCKEWDDISLAMSMLNYEVNVHNALYHGFAASDVLSKRYYVRNRDVLRAIRSHVSGRSTSKLGMILYIADKCEPGRKGDSSALLQLAYNDLNKGFKAVRREKGVK